MKVSGCCIVKNAVKYDFPVVEAVKSILPLCDEFFINVGKSDDGTIELVNGLRKDKVDEQRASCGVNIFESEWDESIRSGGEVLSQETNKAVAHCSGDWIFVIQADEVVHERTLPAIRKVLLKYIDVGEVQGLLFDYIHFYGSFNTYQRSFAWYPNEVRIIRGGCSILSYGDAKGFRLNGKKLRVVHSGGLIHHYGWVRSPQKMLEKRKDFYRLWHEDRAIEEEFGNISEYSFWKDISTLGVFKGTHPEVMKDKIEKSSLLNYPEKLDDACKFKDLRLSIINFLYRIGIRGSKNYKLLK